MTKPLLFVRWSRESKRGPWSKWHIVQHDNFSTLCGHTYLGAWAETTNIWVCECNLCNRKATNK